MSYKRYVTKGALLLAMSALTLAGCNRDKDSTGNTLSNADDNGGYASDNAKMERNSDDVISMADVAATTGSGSTLRTTQTTVSSCATVTFDSSGSLHTMTIDFGTAPCVCADGKTRSGKIIVNYSGHYKDSGSTHTITYSNYFVGGNQLSGSKTVTNTGMNSSGQYAYSVVVNDTLNLGTGSGYIAWVGNRTRTWLAGYSTPAMSDDEYLISGTTTLTRANGNQFNLSITTPLQVSMSCDNIEAGVISITGPGGGTRTLDYGTGTCDDLATLTIGGHTYPITLH